MFQENKQQNANYDPNVSLPLKITTHFEKYGSNRWN